MRLAVAKPDWRIVGGFELLLERLQAGLEARGFEWVTMPVDVPSASHAPYGVVVRDEVWAAAPEYFRYLSVLDTFRHMEFPTGIDCVVSTQPPSFAVAQRPHLSIFFHHLRIYYDLSDVYVRAGFVDETLHARAQDVIRRVDQGHLEAVDRFLVASDEIAARLGEYNAVAGPIDRFLPPPILSGLEPAHHAALADEAGPALCVSRHEFPKRVELFVQAMHVAPNLRGVVVGTGGREAFARHLDDAFRMGRLDAELATAEQVWLNRGETTEAALLPASSSGSVSFVGRLSEDDLIAQYSQATCVVAPAYREDYGLTALEAMSFGKPVIVCSDGGGLVELVDDGVNGFVVEPTAAAIAAAVGRLTHDDQLRLTMSEAARERAREFTWDRAVKALTDALEATVGR